MVLKTGTTTIGVICKDGVVLGADKRATAGNFIVDSNTKKVQKITDTIALTTAGSVSDIQLMIKLIRAQLKLKELRVLKRSSVAEAVGLLSGMVYGNIRRMSMLPGVTQYVVGGVDDDGVHLFDIFPDGSLTRYTDYVTSGSGSVFALGVLDTLYNKEMTVEEGVELVKKSIKAAIRRDNASGDGITIMKITKDGSVEYSEENVKATMEASKELFEDDSKGGLSKKPKKK